MAVTFVTLGTGVNGVGAVSPPWPASGNLVDDIALLFVETANQAPTFSADGGFVLVMQQGTGTAGGLAAVRLSIYWARATSTTPPTPTIATGNDHTAARIATWRGCHNVGNPWDAVIGDVLAAASTTVSIPGTTTSVNGCRIVLSVANATDTGTSQTTLPTNANLTGLAQHHDVNVTAGNGGGFNIASGAQATAGNYGASASSLLTSSVQARISIALKPPTATLWVAPDLAHTPRHQSLMAM